MLIKFICCDVFARPACALVATSPHIVDIEFVPMMTHVEPQKLRDMLQERITKGIDESDRKYDMLVLGFGLCGNSVIGLSCSIPMVIPRIHDCCTVFMGGKDRFLAEFSNKLSSRWCTTGYYERAFTLNSGYPLMDQLESYKTSAEYMAFLDEYDEDTAEFLWQTLHPSIEVDEAVYIQLDGFEYSDSYRNFKELMDSQEVDVKTVDGDLSLLTALIHGDWDKERFLIVPPGKKVVGVYDMDQVLRAEE